MKIRKSVVVNVSRGKVWELITDFRKYPVWLGSNEKIEMTSREAYGEGVTYRVVGIMAGRRYVTDNKVVEWKEDEKLAIVTTSIYGEAYTQFTLKAIPAGCEVAYDIEIALAKKLQDKHDVLKNHFEGSMDETLNRLKNYLEGVTTD